MSLYVYEIDGVGADGQEEADAWEWEDGFNFLIFFWCIEGDIVGEPTIW